MMGGWLKKKRTGLSYGYLRGCEGVPRRSTELMAYNQRFRFFSSINGHAVPVRVNTGARHV